MDEFMMRFHELEEDEYGIGVVEVVLIITEKYFISYSL
jgi:hypothetical protein